MKDRLLDDIAERRAIYPDRFNKEEITEDEIRQLLEAARFAPTHKLTEPWRFKVLMGDSKTEMAGRISQFIQTHGAKPENGERMRLKFDQSQAVLVVSFQRDLRERVPEWEEIAATAMAVQNIWIYTGALGMGGYWSTSAPAIKVLEQELVLPEGERILGVFFLGRSDFVPRQRPSKSVDDYTQWII